MQRIFYALVFVMLFGGFVFGQDGVAFEPMVTTNDLFIEVEKFFADVLKSGFALAISIYFIWFIYCSVQAFLEGKYGSLMKRVKRQDRMTEAVNKIEEKAEAQRIARGRARERNGEIRKFEAEYRSRALQSISLRGNERLVIVPKERGIVDKMRDFVRRRFYDEAGIAVSGSKIRDFVRKRFYKEEGGVGGVVTPGSTYSGGTYYTREAIGDGDVLGVKYTRVNCYTGSEPWDKVRVDSSDIEEAPLAFDNNDYDRVYDSIVAKDHLYTFDGKRVSPGTEFVEYVGRSDSESDELVSDELVSAPLPYGEDDVLVDDSDLEPLVYDSGSSFMRERSGIASWYGGFGGNRRYEDDDDDLEEDSTFESGTRVRFHAGY